MKNRHVQAVLLYALLATVLIFSWFRFGYLYGGGDVGIPAYDPQRIFDIAKFIWWDAAAPGTVVPQGLTSVPFQFIQATLHNLGLSYVAVQALFFWVIIFLMGYGMFLVGRVVFGKEKFLLAILAGLFYMLNPYMMIQVWHRFIHNTFFLAAALPFFFLSFRSWIKNGKYFYLLLFLLFNFVAVYLYGAMAFIATILIFLSLLAGMEIFFPWKGFLNSAVIFNRAFLGIIAWFAVHIWWLLPILNVSPAVLSSQHSSVDNLSTLLSISWQTIIPYSLTGVNPFYLYIESDFGKVFDTFFFRSLPWLPLIFLIPGFLVALKNRAYTFWALFIVIGIFLAKGATSPFGYPYIFGFNNFFPLGVLRNPFEKLGIYLPFAYAIIIPLGVEWYLVNKRRKRLVSKIIVAAVLFLILGVNLWPMWLGNMFGSIEKPAFIKVPESYIQADEYIKNQKKTGRILHLPLTISESATYNWEHGYSGVESSQLYFSSLPSISRGINLGTTDDALTALSYIFTLPNSEDKELMLLRAFNIKFIILHKDMNWLGGSLPDPKELESRLGHLKFLERKSQFGNLIVYELKDDYFNPRLKLTDNVRFFLPSEKNIYWPWLLSQNNEDLLSPLGKSLGDIKDQEKLVVSPKYVYNYSSQKVVKENLLGEIPAAKVLPGSPLYQLIRLKEKIQYFFLPIKEKFSFEITLAGKRLTESYLLKQKDSAVSIVPQLQQYQLALPKLKEGVQARSSGKEGEKEISISFILSRHLATLNLIKEKASEEEEATVEETLKQLTNFMQVTNVIPYNQIIEEKDSLLSNKLISRFNLPVAGKYKLLQARDQFQNIYSGGQDSNIFQINKEVKKLKGSLLDNFISYDNLDLPAGLNEISFNSVSSRNLAKITEARINGNVVKIGDVIEITSNQHEPSYIDIDIDALKGGDYYQLTFESWIKLGDKFEVLVLQDTDPYNPKNPTEKMPPYDNDFPKDPYVNYWNSRVIKFYVNPTTSKTTIRLLVAPWDGCKQEVKFSCSNKDFKYQHERVSEVSFKDIKIIRMLNSPVFLEASFSAKSGTLPVGKIDFIQKNSVFYSGKINLASSGFFIFNETFHPDWKLKLESGGKVVFPSQRFLSNLYGNAWFLEEPGEYNFTLEFTPQKNVMIGVIISMMVLLAVIALAVRQKIRK